MLEPLVNLLCLGCASRVAVVAVGGRKKLGRRPAGAANGAALLGRTGRQAVTATGEASKAHRHRSGDMTRLGRGW